MIPHVIVLEPGLVIYKIYNGHWFFGRPLEELRQDMREITRRCRPDWDITTPELKAAWMDARTCLIRMARPTPRPSVNRISWSPRASVTYGAPSRTRTVSPVLVRGS